MKHSPALLLCALLAACLQSQASTNVLSLRNEFGGRTTSSFHIYPDPEYVRDDVLKMVTWSDAKGTNRMKVVFRTPVYVDRHGDFKETSLYDTNGRLVSVEVVRTNGDENRDCYGRRVYRYDGQPFSYMTEIYMTTACATQDMYSVRREFTDPRGQTNRTILCYIESFRRGTGRKYLITAWSPGHRMEELAVVYSNDDFLRTGFSRVVERYDAYKTLYLKEFVTDPSRTNGSAFLMVRKFFDRRGRPERDEYFLTPGLERFTGVSRAVVEYDENRRRTKLTAYNGRGFALARRYGPEKITQWLRSPGRE